MSKETKKAIFLFGAIAIVFLTQLGSYGLLEPDEGRYAEIGREMAAPGGDWLVPHLNGIPHFQKPPVFYWLTATSIKIFGTNEFAARLPVALSALGVLFLTIGITRHLFRNEGKSASRFALVILATSPLFLVLTRTITPDMHMTFWITAAIYCLLRAREKEQRWGWLFFVCAGLGFLTKGPVAFLIPFSAAIGFRISSKKLGSEIPILPWLYGIPISLVIGLSWFLAISLKFPEMADYFWHHEFLDRFSSGTHGRSRPFWFFIPVLLGGLLPWAFLLPLAFKSRPDNAGLFIGWLVVPFLILSMSGSKLPTYILPIFPGIAVLLGGILAKRKRIALPKVLQLMCVATVVLIAVLPPVISHYFVKPAVVLSQATLVTPIAIIAAVIIWFLRGNQNPQRGSLVVFSIIILIAWAQFPRHLTHWEPLLERQASMKPIAEKIRKHGDKNSRVIACEIRAHGLEFYLRRTVEITRQEAAIAAGKRGDSTVIHEGPKQIAALTAEPNGASIFVVTRIHRFERDFRKRGWIQIDSAGDFVLLVR